MNAADFEIDMIEAHMYRRPVSDISDWKNGTTLYKVEWQEDGQPVITKTLLKSNNLKGHRLRVSARRRFLDGGESVAIQGKDNVRTFWGVTKLEAVRKELGWVYSSETDQFHFATRLGEWKAAEKVVRLLTLANEIRRRESRSVVQGAVTYSFAKLRVTEATYDEIKAKLEDAGYADQFVFNRDAPGLPLLNMHGIALEHEIEMTDGEVQER